MPALHIRFEPISGSNISSCCDEAVVIAKKLNMTVSFEFNGTWCRIGPTDTALEAEQRWAYDRKIQNS